MTRLTVDYNPVTLPGCNFVGVEPYCVDAA
jgi:hypothetical protein